MLPPSVRIFVCTIAQDMRGSFDKLSLVVRELLGHDPQDGALYVFVSKNATRAKVLWWDKNGYCLLYKRLHRALFEAPAGQRATDVAIKIDATELNRLLAGVAKKGRRKKP